MKKTPKSNNIEETKVYSLKEVAAFLRLTEEQVLGLVKENKLPSIEKDGKLFFSKEKINKWIEEFPPDAIDEKNIPEALLKTPLKNLIPSGGILFLPHRKPKDTVLEYLVSKSHQLGCISDPEDFLNCLKAREEMVTTATEKGVAFLHTRQRIPKQILTPFILVAISKEGLDWGAPDGKLTHLLFLIAMRYDIMHLKILSQLARMTNAGLVNKILAQDTPEKVIKVLNNFEKKVPRL